MLDGGAGYFKGHLYGLMLTFPPSHTQTQTHFNPPRYAPSRRISRWQHVAGSRLKTSKIPVGFEHGKLATQLESPQERGQIH